MALQRNSAAWGRHSSNKGFLFQTMGNVRTSITILSFGPLRPLTAKWSTADTPRNRKHHHQLRSEYLEGQSLECSRSTGGFSSMGQWTGRTCIEVDQPPFWPWGRGSNGTQEQSELCEDFKVHMSTGNPRTTVRSAEVTVFRPDNYTPVLHTT